MSSPRENNDGRIVRCFENSVSHIQDPGLNNEELAFEEIDDIGAFLAKMEDRQDSANGKFSPSCLDFVPSPSPEQSACQAVPESTSEPDESVEDDFEGLEPVDMTKVDDFDFDFDELLGPGLECAKQRTCLDGTDLISTDLGLDLSDTDLQCWGRSGTRKEQQSGGIAAIAPTVVPSPRASVLPSEQQLLYQNYQAEQQQRITQAQQLVLASQNRYQGDARYLPSNPAAHLPTQQSMIIEPQVQWPQPTQNVPVENYASTPMLYGQGFPARAMTVLTQPFTLPPNFTRTPEPATQSSETQIPYPYAPHLELRHPTIRTNRSNATLKPNSRYRPNPKYTPLARAPASWDVFRYTTDGELMPYQLYTPQEITRFICKHPLHGGPHGSLSLRIQRNPPRSRSRYPSTLSHRCRFATCPYPNNTINQGHYAVALDENNNDPSHSHDPFLVAGSTHLYCLERFTDLPKIILHCATTNTNFSIGPDTRLHPHEPQPRNPMSLSLTGEADLVNAFIATVRTNTLPSNYPPFDQPNRPYEGTLTHTLSLYKLKHEPPSIAKQREVRFEEAGYVGSTLSSHLGDLEVEAGIRAVTRKQESRARVWEGDGDGDGDEEVVDLEMRRRRRGNRGAFGDDERIEFAQESDYGLVLDEFVSVEGGYPTPETPANDSIGTMTAQTTVRRGQKKRRRRLDVDFSPPEASEPWALDDDDEARGAGDGGYYGGMPPGSKVRFE